MSIPFLSLSLSLPYLPQLSMPSDTHSRQLGRLMRYLGIEPERFGLSALTTLPTKSTNLFILNNATSIKWLNDCLLLTQAHTQNTLYNLIVLFQRLFPPTPLIPDTLTPKCRTVASQSNPSTERLLPRTLRFRVVNEIRTTVVFKRS